MLSHLYIETDYFKLYEIVKDAVYLEGTLSFLDVNPIQKNWKEGGCLDFASSFNNS
jgi:hypothetical protein